MTDATFEDGDDLPLRLKAETAEDLQVLSALLQDAVLPASEIRWAPRKLRFAALVNRFRWEDKDFAERAGRAYERVRAALVISGALKVSAMGVNPKDPDLILSILSLEFDPGEEGAGTLRLILAGDGVIAVQVECLDVTLQDVTRPYAAPSGRAPTHE
jgi:DUF2948 family protein